jgi:MFS family permease
MSLANSQITNEYQETKTISKTETPLMAWFILSSCWAFYLYEYILRASPGVITNELMADFGISAGAVGTLIAFYYFAYVPLQIPCGVITDKFGPRKVVTTSALLCVIGTVIFAKSNSVPVAQFGRFLIGAGSACAYICCLKIASVWFDKSKFALIAGISMMMGTFGGMFAGPPFAHLANTQGWRSAMLIAAIVGAIVMLIAWFVIKDRPAHKLAPIAEGGLLAGLKIIASKPQSWLVGLYSLVMFLPLCVFGELWGTPYLMQRFGISNEIASYGGTVVFVGYAVGCLLSAKLSDYWQSRRKVMSLSVTWTFIGFGVVLYAPGLSFYAVLAVMLASGIGAGLSILYITTVQENNPRKYSATSVGFTNALCMTSGFIFQPLLGKLLDHSWDGSFNASGAPAYTLNDYQFALTAVLFAFLLGRVIMFFVKETYRKDH